MPSINFYDFISQHLKKEGLKPLNRFQLEVLRNPHRFKTIVWHRRAGKTVMSLVEVLKQSQQRIGVYWIVFPFLDEARDAIWNNMLFKVLPEQFIVKKNENFMSVRFTNGSYLRLKGADHPDSLRGPNVCGVVLDEFAKQKLEAWKIISPIIAENKGWAWFVSTPIGKNHLYDYYNRGNIKKNKQWASWYLRASESQIIDADELEREQDDIGPEQYSQEYECAWLEGAGQVFRGVAEILTAIPQEPLTNHIYVCGVDIAKHTDFTVISVFDRQNNMEVYQDRFKQIDWPLQRERIAQISKHYNHAMVALDATGIGDVFCDELARMNVAVEPIKISEPLKRELVQRLSMWIQRKYISILPIKETTDELGDYAYKKGHTGKYVYGAPTGRHDDIVMSIALAVSQLNPLVAPIAKIDLTPLQSYKQRLLSRLGGEDEYFENLREWQDL